MYLLRQPQHFWGRIEHDSLYYRQGSLTKWFHDLLVMWRISTLIRIRSYCLPRASHQQALPLKYLFWYLFSLIKKQSLLKSSSRCLTYLTFIFLLLYPKWIVSHHNNVAFPLSGERICLDPLCGRKLAAPSNSGQFGTLQLTISAWGLFLNVGHLEFLTMLYWYNKQNIYFVRIIMYSMYVDIYYMCVYMYIHINLEYTD